MSQSSSSHCFNPQDEPNKKNSILKKRSQVKTSCQNDEELDQEFQPPLPKGGDLCRSNSKHMSSNKYQKLAKES